MEDILKKNIFIEEDLLKYAPDYNPQDILLRMQLRRDMVKDSHKHGELINCNSGKNPLKKPKGSYKIKKEIVKLRAYFQNKNLQNQCMMKDTKCIKQKGYEHKERNPKISKFELDIVEKELIEDEIYDSKYGRSQIDFVLENNSDFKLTEKEIPAEYKYNNGNKIVNQQVDTKVSNKLIKDKVTTSPLKENNTTILNDDERNVTCNNEYKHDLQSLLIMMTINSDLDENTHVNDQMAWTARTGTSKTESVSSGGNVIDAAPKFISNKYCFKDKVELGGLDEILNITCLDTKLHYRQEYIIKKYLRKWRMFVSKKRENIVIQERQHVLNQFFDKLSKKKNCTNSNSELGQKSKILVRDYNTYQHRYKVQKHIIALQKAKLEEQNKLIEQLKYNKILDSSRQSLDTMRDDVRKTYYEIDKHLKPKIKCLTNELKIKELEEPSLVLHCLKVPHFLQKMEARAREREEKHAIIRERRKQIEEERIRLKQQAELAKSEMDKEEKMRRIKELREKRKKEKIENIRKKQHVERMRALTVMADLHYEKNLMNRYGIRPLRSLLEIKHDNIERAKAHYTFILMKNVFIYWMWYTEDMWFERNYKAEDFHRKKLLRKTFNAFKENHREFVIKKQVADDYYDLYVTQNVFRKFRVGILILKMEGQIKYTKAVLYYNSNILFKTFICWRTLPALNALKREQEARKLKWRQKVLQVVPDYKPPED